MTKPVSRVMAPLTIFLDVRNDILFLFSPIALSTFHPYGELTANLYIMCFLLVYVFFFLFHYLNYFLCCFYVSSTMNKLLTLTLIDRSLFESRVLEECVHFHNKISDREALVT